MHKEKIPPQVLENTGFSLLASLRYRERGSFLREASYKDEMGERFVEQIDFKWDLFRHRPAYWWVVVRTEILDRVIRGFIESEPESTVINLGAGFCTRYYRLANNSVKWFEIDLPQVIAFRCRLNEPERENHIFIPASVMDFSWIDKIRNSTRGKVLFVAEGLLMYLSKEDNKKLLSETGKRFPGARMYFEAISPLLVWFNSMIPSGAKFRWGLKDALALEEWGQSMHFVREYMACGMHPEFLSSFRRWLHNWPSCRGLMKIVEMQFSG